MQNQPPYAILIDPISVPYITSATNQAYFDYFGPVISSLASEASKFLATVTDANKLDVVSTVNSFISATQMDCIGTDEQKIACWLTIRVTKPTKEFEVPRWHQDGRMFPYDKGREEVVRSKYALTMHGPKTLMLRPDTQILDKFREGEKQCLWWRGKPDTKITDEDFEKATDSLRQRLADEYKDTDRIQVRDGEVARFSWGRDDSPVHSEPDLVSDRIFMTVLYGSEPELKKMCEWRNAEYGKFDW